MARESNSSGRRLTAAEKRQRALELRRTGLSYERIGQQLGVSKVMAWKYVSQALAEIKEKTAEEAELVRILELDRLDRLLLGLWQKATQGDVQAVDRALKVMERRARLLGLDKPQKIASTTPDGEEQATGIAILPATAPGVDEWLKRYRDGETSPPSEQDDG